MVLIHVAGMGLLHGCQMVNPAWLTSLGCPAALLTPLYAVPYQLTHPA